MNELRHLNKYFLKYKYRFIIGIIITIIAQIFTLVTPRLVGDSIRALEQLKSIEVEEVKAILLNNIIGILATTLIAGFLTFLMRQTLIVMSRNIEFDLKNDLFRHYESLSQNFYNRNRTGDLINRISEDSAKVRQYVGPVVMYSINTIIRFTVVLVQMYLVSPLLTFYSILPLPILAAIVYKLSNQINKKSTIYQENLSQLSVFIQETFSGIRVIKASAIEKEKEGEFKELSEKSKQKNLNLARTSASIGPLMILLIGASNLTIIFIGGMMYINGEIPDIGVIAQFILYINMLTWPIISIGWVSTMIKEAQASQKRINEFLQEKPDIYNTNPNNTPIEGKISFKDVSFTHKDMGVDTLKNISFELPKGKTLAILGKTGAGKSTILHLIARLYDAESGSVCVDDTPVKDLNLSDLRKSIAFVPQDVFLFSDSIKNNIKFGKENATDEEVIEVAKQADVHKNIINFKDGYDTVLGERGLTLSGGQKQRISIARALIKDAPILLLDDSLSSVDTETEEIILKNLEQHNKNKTCIIVTHRVSSAKNADQIIILENGEIIQQGTHNQLLSTEGYYKELYHKHLLEKEKM